MISRLVSQVAGALLLAFTIVLLAPASASAVGPGAMCEGRLPVRCDAGLFCQHSTGLCRTNYNWGKCVKVPSACPQQIVKPVCGCDGKTYSNNCMRQMAMVSLAHNGRCKTPKT